MKVVLETASHVKDFENVLHIKPKQTQSVNIKPKQTQSVNIKPKQTQFVNNKPKTHNLIREKERLTEGEMVRS
jgi:hypothetical protein